MLFRMMWHAGRYRIPDVLEMTVFDCALALGVDQRRKPNRPQGAQAERAPALSIAERMAIPTRQMTMTPEQLMAVVEVGKTG